MRIGYARVSTRDQNLELQLDALNKVGCERIFTDKLSGALVERPGLREALSHLREADISKASRMASIQRRRRALLLSRNGESSPNGARTDPGAHRCRTGGRPVRRARRGSKALDDRQRSSGRKKAIGKRDAATGGGAQLRRVGPYVISVGTGPSSASEVRSARYKTSAFNLR